MELHAVWGSYVFIIGSLGALSKLLSSALNEETQRNLSRWLGRQVAREPASWVQAANRAFLQTFDWLFAPKKTAWEGSLWAALMVSPVLLVLARLAFLLGGVRAGDAIDLLLFALWLASSVAVFLGSTHATTRSGFVSGMVGFVLLIVLGRLALGELGGLLIGLSVGLFGGTVAGMVFSFGIPGIGLPLGMSMAIASMVLGVLMLALETLSGFGSYALGFGALGFGLGAFVGAMQALGPGPIAPASPLRTFVYSLFFIGLVSVLRLDAASSIVDAVRAAGPRILVFVAFTTFADTFSLLETRWILRRGLDAGTAMMLALLGLDLVLSAAIFLFLPLVLGELPGFFQAALFRGDRPWLGILFWSSFSTSVTFYVFAVSSLLIRPLAHMPKLGRYLAVETRPVLVLTIAVGIAITLIYALGLTVAATLLFLRAGRTSV
jgi:hypothetical protein